MLHALNRRSICLSQPEPNVVIHDGDKAFPQELEKLYTLHESKLLEDLVELRSQLKTVRSDEFWSFLSERMADILGAQMALVAKRILVDEQDTAVEMPPIGEPGACLMASAMHYNDGKGTIDTLKAFKFHAYGCPCSYMRHDKVFVIPEKLNVFITDNPNELPFPCEAYIGIPLFAEGKCFAHFAVLWSEEGAKNRKLSWANIELFMHSLEDIILRQLLEGTSFTGAEPVQRERARIIPHEAVTVAQSLKPYARSLSHELRTPMQGVVGMLDVMYATVLEASEGQENPEVRKVFETLKENIEVVQDSSRRAVEAADNVVHAYDMDMHIPEAPRSLMSNVPLPTSNITPPLERPEILVAGHNLPLARPNKRRREDGMNNSSVSSKVHASQSAWAARTEPSEELKAGVHEAEELPDLVSPATPSSINRLPSPPKSFERMIAPGLRHTQLRNVLQYVVNEGLKVGGRPESAIARETDTGEVIEVQTRSPKGTPRKKLVEWSVEPKVPETMFVDEKDLGKLVSCVFLNAIKFTEEGTVSVTAKISSHARYVVIKITDSGPGIPAAFLPKLFQPFSQEDASLTRQSEGLGLGLMVAKGIARKLGGDLLCTHAETSGPKRGSQFEIRIPLTPGDEISRPGSPHSSIAGYTSGTRGGSVPTASPTIPSSASRPSPELRRATLTNGTAGINGAAARNSPRDTPVALASVLSSQKSSQTPPAESRVPPLPRIKHPMDSPKRPKMVPRKSSATIVDIDRNLASKYPLTFLVAEDNKINRKLLVSMLSKFGYKTIHEAYDGAEAVRQMEQHWPVDVVLMDLWMPFMDGYEATEKILSMTRHNGSKPTVLAVTADVTDGALERAAKVGMKGFMTKPFKLLDLQRLIHEYCASHLVEVAGADGVGGKQ